jgi:hypothetical protein
MQRRCQTRWLHYHAATHANGLLRITSLEPGRLTDLQCNPKTNGSGSPLPCRDAAGCQTIPLPCKRRTKAHASLHYHAEKHAIGLFRYHANAKNQNPRKRIYNTMQRRYQIVPLPCHSEDPRRMQVSTTMSRSTPLPLPCKRNNPKPCRNAR